jgi:cation:H+ antiporter
MVIANLVLFLIFLVITIKAADHSIKYSSRIARKFRLPEFIVSFFIIAFISVLPEATLSIISAFKGSPGLGLGTLLGSNIADLTLVFGITALFSNGGIKVRSKILRNNFFYLILLIFPLILGLDGKFSRIDGSILVLLGIIFFIRIYNQSHKFSKKFKYEKKDHFIKNSIFLILSLSLLILGAFMVVKYSLLFAEDIKIPEIIIGITILAFGTCLPELVFSINAVKKNHDELALGDVLGTVVTDSTIVLGLVALISPFSYDVRNIYLLGGAMFIAGIFATLFMKSDKTIKKGEGVLLIIAYILFVMLEFLITKSYSLL